MIRVINLRKMKKHNFKFSDRYNIKKKDLTIYKKDIFKILFTVISLVSIILGCMLYKNNNINEVSDYCINFIKQLYSETLINVCFTFIKFDIVYFILLFLFGTSILGAPLTFIPVIVKCIFIGYLSALMYNEYDLKGILFCLVLLFPLFAITTTSLIYAANESVYMCKYIFDLLKNKNTANNISVRLYLIRYVFLFGINLIAIIINSLLTTLIVNKFILF